MINLKLQRVQRSAQTPECPTPTLYMRGYDSSKTKRPAPKVRPTENKEKKSRKRKQSDRADEVPTKKVPFVDDESLFGENIDFEHPASLCSADTDPISKVEQEKVLMLNSLLILLELTLLKCLEFTISR